MRGHSSYGGGVTSSQGRPPTAVTPGPDIATDPGVAPSSVLAVFDLDKTIIDTSATMAYRKPLADRGLISTGEMIRMLAMLVSYMFTGHDDESMDATRDTLVEMVKGRRADDLAQVAREALSDVIIPVVYAEARELIDRHRALGHRIAIITASPRDMVAPIAEELGADHLIATELEVAEDGTYTGEVPFFAKGTAKVGGLRRLASRHGYLLAAGFAYSDSATDLPLLESVGHPTAVNPDKPLRRIAETRHWPVLEFRRREPLFRRPERGGVIAGASAGIAVLAALATGLLVRHRGRD
jgi:HAD superfamily hydrolase (TIGR01490 family)